MHGIDNKKITLTDYCQKYNIELRYVGYVGNDINDLDVMRVAGTTFCPSDSHSSIKKISDYTLNAKGGDGVIRELLDLLKLK